MVDEIRELKDKIKRLEDEVDVLESKLDVAKDDADRNERVVNAVNSMLDEVHRPVGTLEATIPDTPAARRALIALYDAVRRPL